MVINVALKKFKACLRLKHEALFNNMAEVLSGHVCSVYGHCNTNWKEMPIP